jgi:O-acetyl-ADP-ribose deacetylase (regulator of RNase III)
VYGGYQSAKESGMNRVILEQSVANGVIRVVQGDITLAETDAVVNAANSHLQHGGGVAGAIVRRGGRVIQEESDRVGFVPEGEVAVTSAGDLAARYVIHAVGPRGGDSEGDDKLARAVASSLAKAAELGLASISLPAISSGIFGFPKDRCAEILIETAWRYLAENPDGPLRQIEFVLFDDETAEIFRRELSS